MGFIVKFGKINKKSEGVLSFLPDCRAVYMCFHSERSRFMWFSAIFLWLKGGLLYSERLPFGLFPVMCSCLWRHN